MYGKAIFGKEARERLINGVNILVNAVKVTLGGNGKNVIIADKMSSPHITKDGVTVAKHIFLRDDVQQAGVEIVRQASIRAAEETGDGTTTATVIAGFIANKGFDEIENLNIQPFKEGMEHAVSKVVDELKELSTDSSNNLELLKNIATVSANGDKVIGNIVATSILETGKHGSYSVDTTDKFLGIKFEKEVGYSFNKEFSAYFESISGTGSCEIYDPKILILNCYLGSMALLEDIYDDSSENNYNVVIMYKDIDGAVLQNLQKMYSSGNSNIILCPLPDYGDLMELAVVDLAEGTDSKQIQDLNGVKRIPLSSLGTAKEFKASGNSINIIFNNDDATKERLEVRAKNIKDKLDKCKHEDVYLYETRYKRLSNNVGVFKVGTQTEVEYKEIKDRIDDAIGSVVSAMEEGVVTGGGISLLQASYKFKDEKFEDESFQKGYDIVIQACKEPFTQIVKNCGVKDVDSVLSQVINSNFKLGYNAKDKIIENIKEKGIVDSTKVVAVSLKSGLSASVGILTTDCVIFPEDNIV